MIILQQVPNFRIVKYNREIEKQDELGYYITIEEVIKVQKIIKFWFGIKIYIDIKEYTNQQLDIAEATYNINEAKDLLNKILE